MSKDTVLSFHLICKTPEQALNGINLGLKTTGNDHVFKQLQTWPTDQLAAVLLEALYQRNRLLKEKEERRTAKKENKE